MSTTGQTAARPSTSNSTRLKPPFLESLKILKSSRGGEQESSLEEFEEGFDLHFFCADGVISTHRLVISNVSKYIMSMLDDQPPWFPTNIHVIDFPRSIIQILIDLAYTGEMRFPENLQNDVFDAMQTLGWIHTDCLSAAYYDDPDHIPFEKELSKEFEENGPKKQTRKLSESREVSAAAKSPKMSSRVHSVTPKTPQSPLNDRVDTVFERFSCSDVGDESMEISNLPEISLSEDEDSSSVTNLLASKSMTRKVFTGAFDGEKTISLQNENKSSIRNGKGRMSIDKAADENIQPHNYQLEDETPKSPGRRSSRRSSRRISISESNVEPENEAGRQGMSTPQKPILARIDSKDETVEKGTERKSRKSIAPLPAVADTLNGPSEAGLPVVDENSQMSSASETSSLNGSPSKRQRRKPKRFDEEDEDVSEKVKLPEPFKLKGKRGRKKKVVLEGNKSSDLVDADPAISTSSTSKDNKEKNCSVATTKKPQDSVKTALKRTPKKKLAAEVVETPQPNEIKDSVLIIAEVSKPEVAKPTKTPQKLSVPKKKLSEEGPRSSLITSYFTKAVPAKTEDTLDDQVLEVQDSKDQSFTEHVLDPITDSGPEVVTKRQKKKRTFDQINDAAATLTTEDHKVTGSPRVAKVGRPVRKSMRPRNPSKNQNEPLAEDAPTPTVQERQEQSPKRKRTKKEDKVAVVEDTTLPQPSQTTEAPTRRSSKK